MHVIICGGRDYTPTAADLEWLDHLHARHGQFGKVMTGDACGVDTWARWWATRERIPCMVFVADWASYGKRAGPLRNAAMLADLCRCADTSAVIAFPGGRGTAAMIRQARTKDVQVFLREPTP